MRQKQDQAAAYAEFLHQQAKTPPRKPTPYVEDEETAARETGGGKKAKVTLDKNDMQIDGTIQITSDDEYLLDSSLAAAARKHKNSAMNGKEKGTVPPPVDSYDWGSSSNSSYEDDDNVVEDMERDIQAGFKAVAEGKYE